MRIRIIGLVLLAILATSQADRALAQRLQLPPPPGYDDGTDYETLLDRFRLYNECGPMDLVVETLHPDAAEIGLTEASIQAAVESRLRSARLYDSAADPRLYVNVLVSGMAVAINLDYQKPVHDPASGVTRVATTWDTGGGGTHGGGAASILSSISGYMDEFLVEYLRVNEAACKGVVA